MRFDYQFRTSDNVRKKGIVSAASRDAAFALLRSRGIRPEWVRESAGFFNKLFGRGKRWIAICVLIVVAASAIAYAVSEGRAVQSTAKVILSQTRRQLIGDSAVIEYGMRSGWAGVFPEEGERFLASFAVPGVPAGLKNTNVEELEKAIARRVDMLPTDSIEEQQIKSMVEGMKDELRRFIADGGTIVEYGEELVRRQEAEIGYFKRAKTEVEGMIAQGRSQDEVMAVWRERNDHLRRMGVRLIPIPEGL